MGTLPKIYTPKATNTLVERDIRDRFADIVNIKDYGAIGDSLHDDTGAWNYFKNVNGGVKYIPSGTYRINGDIFNYPEGRILGYLKECDIVTHAQITSFFAPSWTYVVNNTQNSNEILPPSDCISNYSSGYSGNCNCNCNCNGSNSGEIDASYITSGVLSLDRIPSDAIERLIQVENQTERFALTTDIVQNGDSVLQKDTHVMYHVIDQTNLNSESGYIPYQALTAVKATKDSDGNIITDTYATKALATTATAGLMSASDKAKLNGIANGAQANIIDGITVNGTAVNPVNKIINLTIPEPSTVASHTHGNITNDGKLSTANRVAITDNNKVITISPVTSTELGYLSGVTNNIQNQITNLQTQVTNKVDDTNVVHLTGNENISGAKTFAQGPYGTSSAIANSTINLANGCVFTKTISANTTFTITGVPTGKAATFNLILTNGGAFTVAWPASVKWTDDTAPDLTASGIDVLTFVTPNGGTTWYGTVAISGVTA